jgi:hypothetical protein
MDGHCSHHTEELLHFALENNIIILGYPPHCMYALQGLDVVYMKEAWKTYISLFEEVHKRAVKKSDFVEVFDKAFLEVFTKDTIQDAF